MCPRLDEAACGAAPTGEVDVFALTDALPLWGVFLVTLALVLLAVEVGYRLGQLRQKAASHEKEAPVGAMVGATLGLLAFLLAFTFGMAANLFQAKREVVLDEANAIGTTYLRADFLPESRQRAVRDLLREYVDVRLAAVETGDVATAIRRSEQIHGQLWAQANASMRENPGSIAAGLFVQTLNDVIDLHAKRILIAVRSRIPPTIWVALLAIAFFAFGTMGYHSGLAVTNRSFAVIAVAIIFSGVIWLVRDLDTATEGTLQVSQQAMIDLRNSMTD
jgi:hypothetical protein